MALIIIIKLSVLDILGSPGYLSEVCLSLKYVSADSYSKNSIVSTHIGDVLRNLIPFVQFEKHEKHPWMGVTFSNVSG